MFTYLTQSEVYAIIRALEVAKHDNPASALYEVWNYVEDTLKEKYEENFNQSIKIKSGR